MNKGLILLVGGLVAILSMWGGWWYYNNFSWVAEEVAIGYQGEARFNDLLAAQRFLNTQKSPAKSMVKLVGLPPLNGTLVMPGQRLEIGPALNSKLLEWVRGGGHLVVTASESDRSGGSQDGLLDSIGVERLAYAGESPLPHGPTDVDIPEADDFLQVQFCPQTTLKRELKPDFSIRSEYGDHLLRYQLGKGFLTVLSDARFMENASIGNYDHAAFVWYLTHYPQQGEIWLVYGGDMPPLWKWLGQYAWMVLVSAAILFAAWLGARRRRFGPLLGDPPLARRRLLDHIEASGRFLWRNGQHARLIAGVREALHRALTHRHPALVGLAPAALSSRLAELSGYAPNAIHHALFDPYSPNEYEFTETISLLESIRKTL